MTELNLFSNSRKMAETEEKIKSSSELVIRSSTNATTIAPADSTSVDTLKETEHKELNGSNDNTDTVNNPSNESALKISTEMNNLKRPLVEEEVKCKKFKENDIENPKGITI